MTYSFSINTKLFLRNSNILHRGFCPPPRLCSSPLSLFIQSNPILPFSPHKNILIFCLCRSRQFTIFITDVFLIFILLGQQHFITKFISFLCSTDRVPTFFYGFSLSSNDRNRAGRADTKTVWEPYRSFADTLPLDYDRCAKEKSRKKKWTE